MESENLNAFLNELEVFLIGCYVEAQIDSKNINIDNLSEIGFRVSLKSPLLEVHRNKTILKQWAEYFDWCTLEKNDIIINKLDKLCKYNERFLSEYPSLVEKFRESAFELKEQGKTKKLSIWF